MTTNAVIFSDSMNAQVNALNSLFAINNTDAALDIIAAYICCECEVSAAKTHALANVLLNKMLQKLDRKCEERM